MSPRSFSAFRPLRSMLYSTLSRANRIVSVAGEPSMSSTSSTTVFCMEAILHAHWSSQAPHAFLGLDLLPRAVITLSVVEWSLQVRATLFVNRLWTPYPVLAFRLLGHA